MLSMLLQLLLLYHVHVVVVVVVGCCCFCLRCSCRCPGCHSCYLLLVRVLTGADADDDGYDLMLLIEVGPCFRVCRVNIIAIQTQFD